MIGKLGRLPLRHDPRTLQLARFMNLSTLPAVPAAFDWSQKDGADLTYPLLGNGQYGDCVFASACHQIGTWTGQTGVEQTLQDSDALDAYAAFTGFNPADPSTDNGANMLDVAVRWRSQPIAGHRIKAFAAVDVHRPDLVLAAAALFGGLWTGWGLPAAWQGADEWTVGPGLAGQWAPWSWGGHAVHLAACSPAMHLIATWGARKAVTPSALATYCDEAYALISEDMWTTLQGDRCPSGLDGAGLAAALDAVTAP